ncbi:MAG: DUF5317 domain-containing protein [Anaerolineaceae bacterium]|nr:DUF5317 domain-containing protein [Anaerolineaceae bacterium]
MVLLVAVVLGLTSGFLRAKFSGRLYQAVEVRYFWLILAAFLPQFFAFYLPATRSIFPDNWVPVVLIGSQLLLLLFAWLNRRLPGFWLLGLGLLANFIAISLNGGMMPLMPENAARLMPADSSTTLQLGERVGFGKDILLEKANTRLWFLGDVFMLPEIFRYPLAFSIGDILISTGAFWLLWRLGSPRQLSKEVLP